MTDTVKKFAAFLLSMLLLALPALADGEERFTDAEMGISFAVPAGWGTTDEAPANASVKAHYRPTGDTAMTAIDYAVVDLWTSLNLESVLESREKADLSVLSKETFSSMMGGKSIEELESVEYAGITFYKGTYQFDQQVEDKVAHVSVSAALAMTNGYLVLFTYSSADEAAFTEHQAAFEALMASIQKTEA